MVNRDGGIRGPMGIPRPLARCDQQIVFPVEGRGIEIDTDQLEDSIEPEINEDVTVRTRPARFDGDVDVLIITGDSIVREEEIRGSERQLIAQTDLEVRDFRIEAV